MSECTYNRCTLNALTSSQLKGSKVTPEIGSKEPEEAENQMVQKRTPTTASAWKQSSGTLPMDQEMPSGNVALVKIPGAEVFFKAGVIPNSLKGVVEEAIKKGEAPDLGTLAELGEQNLEMVEDVIRLANTVTIESVVQPAVRSDLWTEHDAALNKCSKEEIGQKIPPLRRDDDVLYVDDIVFEDRLFILQLAFGGTRDLEAFRQGLAGNVEPVPAGKAVPGKTKSAARPRAKR